MTDSDTVPVSEMGIGDDDDVKAELEQHAEIITEHFVPHDVTNALEVKNKILDGVAHLHIPVHEERDDVPDDLQNHLIANGLVMVDVRIIDGRLETKWTTGDVYETWSSMSDPLDDADE